MSKLLLYTALIISFITGNVRAADGFEYKFDLDNIADTTIFLAYHYGDKQYIADTLMLDKEGKVTISADTLLPSGLYMIVFPSRKNEYFEFVVREPKFSMTGDVNDLVGSIQFKGSKENEVFYQDLRFLQAKRTASEPLTAQLQTLEPDSPEQKAILDQLEKLNQEVKDWRKDLLLKHPDLLYIKILKALEEQELPEPPRDAQGNITDSFFQFRYARRHGLDQLDWSDERLLRTPVVYNVMERYLNTLSYRSPDSLSVSVDNILNKSRANPELFKFCLVWLLNEYANSNVMGMDGVYVHIALKYYDKGEATWLDEAQRFRITDRAKRMEPTLIGKTAPNIIMKDVNGRTQNLYSLNTKYTILYFWDPDCSHCQKETPALKKAFDQVKTRYDISLFAVNTQLELDKWLKFIEKHSLDGWYHVADFDQTSEFRTLYDINATPVLFLLDNNKQIVAKRLVAEQLEEFMDAWENQFKP